MSSQDELNTQAWIGDAVLALYVRLRILRDEGRVDGAKAERMSSNQFLSACGQPTLVEAEIGRAYDRGGLEAAFQLIEEKLMPVFERREKRTISRDEFPRKRKKRTPPAW
ncbi:MAG: ribonuclease III domain-containing protein [Bryobacteraceae bacterium]|nr:ribonuclease III domain-containing protein [Bryobacteraceae bacterium]MDW8378250.1 ribonuclease III domain-containing protein [Bryobacterales bacterium]